MKALTIWFIDEATMCCWLMKTTFKLIYGLPMKKQTPTCVSVISITHCTDFLTFPLLFLPILFHLHIQYLLFHQHRFGENYIHVACNVFTAKNDCVTITIAFTEQPYNWTLLHIFFNDSGHRCRTAIFLNTSELLNATCVQNHSNTLENNRTYLKNDSKWFFFEKNCRLEFLELY